MCAWHTKDVHQYSLDGRGNTGAYSLVARAALGHIFMVRVLTKKVIHGGSGTLARVVHSGVPAVVVPILPWSDQNFWGERVEALGVGRRVALGLRRSENGTPKGRVGATFDEELAQALTDVLTDGVQRAAKDMGAQVRAEKGVEKAAGYICTEGLLMDEE